MFWKESNRVSGRDTADRRHRRPRRERPVPGPCDPYGDLGHGYLQGFLHATFAMASAHREYGKEFKAMMRTC